MDIKFINTRCSSCCSQAVSSRAYGYAEVPTARRGGMPPISQSSGAVLALPPPPQQQTVAPHIKEEITRLEGANSLTIRSAPVRPFSDSTAGPTVAKAPPAQWTFPTARADDVQSAHPTDAQHRQQKYQQRGPCDAIRRSPLALLDGFDTQWLIGPWIGPVRSRGAAQCDLLRFWI